MNMIRVSAEERLDTFSREKTELLKLLIEKESSQKQKIRPYPRGDGTGEARLPASWAQRRLWFIDQLEGGTAAYNMSLVVRLRGVLDQEALQKALDTIVQRHEVLRTIFVTVEGDPRQEIAADGHFALRVIDLSGHKEAKREEQVRRQKAEEAYGKFDLRVGPMIRGRLVRLQPEDHVLLVTLHHIVSDGWSIGVLINELTELYGAYRHGRSHSLEPMPIQYADYAQWQRQWLHGEELDRQLSYWRTCLNGAAPLLALPTDRPRPASQSYRGGNIAFVLNAQLSAQLRAFAQQREMTLFMLLYAGWAILLSRLSGQDDVVIGTPVANRQRPELEGLIGFLVNTLVLRVCVRSDSSVEEFLEQVREVTLGAYDHQDVAFEQVVEALQPQRSLSRHPLFQVMLSLQNAPKSELRLSGLTVTAEDAVDETSKFDLDLFLEERDDEIVCAVNFATDLFDRQTVERWMACFTALLKGMTEEVQSRIGDLPILSESERHRVIDLFNATQAAYPKEKLIHELFEEQVARTPQAVAVVYGKQSLTYAELNVKANQLARYLSDKGIGAERLVALCVERSLEMVVALLGILKAGGAYVPLDPAYPTERLAYILNDAAPDVLLTQERLKWRLQDTTVESIALDNDWSEIAEKTTSNLDYSTSCLRSCHLAYVIYTSGSTGQAKGVMIDHRSVVNLWHGLEHIYRRSADCQRVALNASFNFDASVQQLVQLLSGRTIFVVPEQSRVDASLLLKFMDENRIDGIDCTPSQLRSWISAGMLESKQRQPHIVLVGGEAIDEELWSSLSHCSGKDFYNVYGPTECTVDATIAHLERDTAEPHIGRPMENRSVYILDGRGRAVPIGVEGEIYVGGAGVARGYLNRPELTAERFLPDPFSADPQARVYRTGDLGRWRPDGSIEYLRRNDYQVKIRGFRIELGEIEMQLMRHAQVKEAVVTAREDVPGEKRLVAYVIVGGPTTAESVSGVDALRAHLKTALPEYMVPSAFVILERLPLTSNGKLDRRALPAPGPEAYVSRQYEAPQGEVERTLADIWERLLPIDRVGRQDDFFELGGHSLLATRVISHIRELLRVELPVRALFDTPTVEQLSVRVTAEGAVQAAQEALRMSSLARDFRQEIDVMHDDVVLERIAELERELGHTAAED